MKQNWLGALLVILFVACERSENATDRTPGTQGASSGFVVDVDWPFDNPQNLAVITLDRIMDGSSPILYVTRDEDDGGWQFLDGGDVSEENAMVVSLREVADHDPTIKPLADLPLGWYAVRDAVGKPWQRSAHAE